MIKLVIRNLISNAIKFTIPGNDIILDAAMAKDLVRVSVKDHGIGIKKDDQYKIFSLKRFSTKGTSNEAGMGFGLMLCKDFVEKNGGEIWFESELGKGSTFYFSLPLNEKNG